LVERLRESGIELHMTEPARQWAAQKGFDPQYGARPLRRTLQRYVENPLSVRLLKGDFRPGDSVVIDVHNGELVFDRHMEGEQNYMEIPQRVDNETMH
jgi:ATP-dependent Clp protease ATP-binding subunit ClpA